MLLSQVTCKRGINQFVKEPTVVVLHNTRFIRQLDFISFYFMCKFIGVRVIAFSIYNILLFMSETLQFLFILFLSISLP